MIMDPRLPPEIVLPMIDDIPDDPPSLPSPAMTSRVTDAHDRARVLQTRSLIGLDGAKVAVEDTRIIIPMDGHGQGVCDEDAPEASPDSVNNGRGDGSSERHGSS